MNKRVLHVERGEGVGTMAKRQSWVAAGHHWQGTLQGISCIVLDRVGEDGEVPGSAVVCVCMC